MAGSKRSGKGVSRGGGDVITVDNKGNDNAIAAGREAKATISHGGVSADLQAWRKDMEQRINAIQQLPQADKADLQENVRKIAAEASRGNQADPGRLERLLNGLGAMAPDIFEVALATLANPLAGLGLVVKKIGDKAKLEASGKKA